MAQKLIEAKLQPKPYQVGKASWYGKLFHGKTTASGEPYDMFKVTAAHPKLPLGSFVRVTNLANRRSVVVRINDRGPITPGRVIDVSYEAARILRFHRKGIQRVRLDVVDQQAALLAAETLPLFRKILVSSCSVDLPTPNSAVLGHPGAIARSSLLHCAISNLSNVVMRKWSTPVVDFR